MPVKYKVGNTVYFIESNQEVIEGTVIRYGSGFYTIRFTHYDEPAVIRIKEHRIFSNEEEGILVIDMERAASYEESCAAHNHS